MGRCRGSERQQEYMIALTNSGAFAGFFSRLPINKIRTKKSLFALAYTVYGVSPKVNSSHRTTPKDHTSDWWLNSPSFSASIAIHLIGNNSWLSNMTILNLR
jgi:hypothetical protein